MKITLLNGDCLEIVVQQMPASPVAVPNFAGYSAEKPNKPGKSKF